MPSLAEHHQSLIDPEKVIVHRQSFSRRLYQGFSWPLVYGASCLCFLLIAGVKFHDYSTRHDADQSDKTTQTDPSHATVEASHADNHVVLHSERRCISSPNANYQFCLREDGDLLLSHNEASTTYPVWWANSGDYKRADDAWESYATLDVDGVLRVEQVSKRAGTHREQWSSAGLRSCKGTTGEMLVAAQALTLDDNGRLTVSNVQGQVTCVLHSSDYALPELHRTVDYQLEEPDVPAPRKGRKPQQWPAYRNSSHLSLLQLRAMLEKDLAEINMTFGLNATQRETIYNTAIIIPTWHGHLQFVTKFLRYVEVASFARASR